jgi:hypothetical protein
MNQRLRSAPDKTRKARVDDGLQLVRRRGRENDLVEFVRPNEDGPECVGGRKVAGISRRRHALRLNEDSPNVINGDLDGVRDANNTEHSLKNMSDGKIEFKRCIFTSVGPESIPSLAFSLAPIVEECAAPMSGQTGV